MRAKGRGEGEGAGEGKSKGEGEGEREDASIVQSTPFNQHLAKPFSMPCSLHRQPIAGHRSAAPFRRRPSIVHLKNVLSTWLVR